MLKAFSHGTEGKHFSFRYSFLGGLAVAQDTGKLWNLSEPAAINFFLALDAEIHD